MHDGGSAQGDQGVGALGALERRADGARQELRSALGGECAELRHNLAERFAEAAATFEVMRADHTALSERSEAQPPALRLEIASAVESATRALEAKIVQLQSSLVRADQKAKQHAAALEESKEEALGKLEEAQEARLELGNDNQEEFCRPRPRRKKSLLSISCVFASSRLSRPPTCAAGV